MLLSVTLTLTTNAVGSISCTILRTIDTSPRLTTTKITSLSRAVYKPDAFR